LEYDFDEITVDFDIVNGAGFVYSERPIDGGVGDNERGHGFEKRIGMVGGSVPPVARYPTTSDAAVAILCPLAEALGGCLAEHPIGLGDRAIGVDDPMTLGSLGTRLQGTATQAIGLGEVEQEGCTEATDHTGALDQQVGDTLGVAQQGSEAGGGDDGKHGPWGRGVERFVPLA